MVHDVYKMLSSPFVFNVEYIGRNFEIIQKLVSALDGTVVISHLTHADTHNQAHIGKHNAT